MLMRAITLVRCSATAVAISLLASAAHAQQTPDDQPVAPADPGGEVDEIVVTGLRASLESVRNIRRNSDEIVDAVVAEDIAKLPDLNTAQIAARIPGVQVYRQGGEAQNVLVRGLPNFTTTYNGREIFTAETRIVALQDFPAANVAALEVYKTSAADLIEPGLAGLINVRSRMPFDFEDGQIAGSVWGLYTVQADKLTPNFNFLATKRWDVGDGGEFGVLLNASRVEMTYLDAEISNTDFLQTFRAEGGVLRDDFANGTAARFPDIQRLFYRSGNRVRPSVNGAIQYKPNVDIEFYLEGLWQGFRNKIDDRLLAAELFNGAQVSSLVFREGTNLVSGGTVNGLPGVPRDASVDPDPFRTGSLFSFQGATLNKTDTYQFAGGVKATFDKLNVHIDIARTDSTFTGSTESVDRRWTQSPAINFDTDLPAFEITNIDLTDPSQQFFDGLFEENQRSAGDDWQLRGDLEYLVDGNLIRSIQAGVRYTDRDAVREFANRFSRPATPTNATALPVEFDVFRGVDVGGTSVWAAPTYRSIRDNIGELRQIAGFNTTDPVARNLLYTANEKNLAAYGQVNLGSGDLEGTLGLRVSRVKTRVAGPAPTGIPEIDDGSTDTSWLPNASIRYRVTPDIQLRAAVSKTRTLPTFQDLNPALVLGPPPAGGVGTESDPRRGSGGNPFLSPFTSWNFDAAVEYYFSPAGFVSLSGFHREVDGFIQQNTFRVNDPTLGVVEITGPVNTGKGRITGAELQGQVFADIDSLPDWAKGFGMQVNVTYIDAKTEQNDGAGGLSLQPITDQLNGVSKWNANIVGIYERYGASVRLSYNDRSSFRATQQFRGSGNAGDAGNDIYTETARPAGRLDLSLSYNINDDFAVFGDWTNITREQFRQDFTSARNGAPEAEFIRYLRDDESTVSLGVRFRFGR
jgi:iron complex outermembrane recepter protein